MPCAHRLISGENDGQAGVRTGKVRGEVEALSNGAHEKLLFQAAERIMIGLIVLLQPFIRASKLARFIQLSVMNVDSVGSDVAVNVRGGASPIRVDTLNRCGAQRPDDVLHEIGGLAHHRTPSSFVPAHRTIFKCNLELPIIVLLRG